MALSNEYKNTVAATPLPELLRKSGYYTAIVGKGHFAPFGISASNPKNIGFIDAVARISWERISFFLINHYGFLIHSGLFLWLT